MILLPYRQSGVALLGVLVLVAITAMVLASIVYRHQLEVNRTLRYSSADQAVLLALSGESYVKSLLKTDLEDSEFDSLEEDWARLIPPLPVEGGTLSGCVIDLHSKFNINTLGLYNEERWNRDLSAFENGSIIRTYLRLQELLELNFSEDRAAVIVDWVDADEDLISGGGAEADDYSLLDQPRIPPGLPMVDFNELAAIKGYSSLDLIQLAPYATVLPEKTAMNINTISGRLLQALSPNIDEFLTEEVLNERPFETVDAFYESLQALTREPPAELKKDIPEDMLTVQSKYFELRAQIQLHHSLLVLHSIIQRRSANDIRVINRRIEFVPPVQPRNKIEEFALQPLCVDPRATDSLEDDLSESS